jgi:hypothetical protein
MNQLKISQTIWHGSVPWIVVAIDHSTAGSGDLIAIREKNPDEDGRVEIFTATGPLLEALGYTTEQDEWEPEEGDTVFRISGAGMISEMTWHEDSEFCNSVRDLLGVYRTKKEAEKVHDAIKAAMPGIIASLSGQPQPSMDYQQQQKP